jgi:hypothetical protein
MFLPQQGHGMYAQITDDLIEDKAKLFDIGKVYNIKYFIVENAKKSFRAVDRDLMIDVTQYTTAEVVQNPPQSIPEYIYRITQFPAIRVWRVAFNYTGK